jgi:hypothetical protein
MWSPSTTAAGLYRLVDSHPSPRGRRIGFAVLGRNGPSGNDGGGYGPAGLIGSPGVPDNRLNVALGQASMLVSDRTSVIRLALDIRGESHNDI